MLPRNNPDRIHVNRNDHYLVANAALFLPAVLASTLACHNGNGEGLYVAVFAFLPPAGFIGVNRWGSIDLDRDVCR